MGTDPRLLDTRRAFDGVADEYDGPLGNNALVQRMREALWREVTCTVPAGSRLLDLGCGTGIDAAYFASMGYGVLATDWSPRMVERTRERARHEGLEERLGTEVLGMHELRRLEGERFDCIYSDLGAINCVLDLAPVAAWCARLLAPNGTLILSAIGRLCPWEVVFYALRGDVRRATLRFRSPAPVPLRGERVWTRYYMPRELYRQFAADFALERYRGMAVVLPPPYLIHVHRRLGKMGRALGAVDDALGDLPLLREAGDHVLMVMRRREDMRVLRCTQGMTMAEHTKSIDISDAPEPLRLAEE